MKKQVGDLSVVNSRLDKEVADLGSKLEESESKFGSLTKAKKGQDQTVEELKRNIEDETRVSGCFSLKNRLRKIWLESELNTNPSGKFPGATECKMKSCFSGRKVPNGNLCSISSKPSLLSVAGFRGLFSVNGTDLCK